MTRNRETEHSERDPAGRVPGKRALALGLALIPANIYFLMYMEVGFNQGLAGSGAGPYPSTISLFANCIFFLVALTCLNMLLGRAAPRAALSRAELLVIYVMLTISTAIVSIDYMDVLVPMMGHPFRYADNVNRWEQVLWPHIPTWISVRDPAALQGWYLGNTTLYTWQNLRPWLVPVAAWSAVIFAMLFVMFCINTIVRERWMVHDKLQFPIVELPMQITQDGCPLLRSRLMWLGFGLAGGISLWNGMHYYFPLLPTVPVKMWDLRTVLVTPPWNAVGNTPISYYPYAVGLGFLLPLDMLFSCWFFFILWRVIRVFGSMYGVYQDRPDFPYMDQQALGAYLLIGVFALWTGRKHLAWVARQAVRRETPASPDDPVSYRTAVIGVLLGTLAVAWFFQLAGLRWWMSLLAVGLYFFLALAIARMHAEFGPPAHDLHFIGPEMVLTDAFGSRFFSARELASLSWFWWFNRAYRSIPIAYQLDGMKIAQRSGAPQRYMAKAVALASIAAVVCGFWFYLHFGYQRGAEVGMAGHVRHFGVEGFSRHFDVWITTPTDPKWPRTIAIGWGMAVAYVVYMLKLNIGWWPLHPLGFAVSTSYSIGTLWFPLFVAWLAKLIAFKAGGMRAYRAALPFFLGLILGDFIVGCAWPLAGMILGIPTYSFMQ